RVAGVDLVGRGGGKHKVYDRGCGVWRNDRDSVSRVYVVSLVDARAGEAVFPSRGPLRDLSADCRFVHAVYAWRVAWYMGLDVAHDRLGARSGGDSDETHRRSPPLVDFDGALSRDG